MIDIEISRSDWPGPRRFVSPNSHLSIGNGEDASVRLSDDSLLDIHANVLTNHRFVYVMAVGPIGMSGQFTGGMGMLGPDDKMIIGRYQLRIQVRYVAPVGERPRYLVRDETEAGLLAAVLGRQAGARAVYADWLELQGDAERAELLRVQDAIAAGADDPEPLAGRLRAIAASVDLEWRVLVTNARVGCLSLVTGCPMRWSMLAPTERSDVRHCTTCKQPVYYALSIGEARRHAAARRCVAVDVLAARWDDDLSPPFQQHRCPKCRTDLGAHLLERISCPECGYSPTDGMTGQFIERSWPAAQIRA